MWWKYLSIALIAYSIVAGLLVPLKPGITHVTPVSAKTGQAIEATFHGYNSFYTRSAASDIRIWLEFDSTNALGAQNIRVVDDTTLKARFVLPAVLPLGKQTTFLNAIVDHPSDGVSLLPDAMEVSLDTAARGDASGWTQTPIGQLHIVKDLSYPYRNVIYETIRNTYFHVPMWFALMFLFVASAVYSIRFLSKGLPEYDRKASAYAEMGLVFGGLGLVTGMLWAHFAWGKAWSNDIKQLMTAVCLLIYLAYFILRRSFDEPEKGARLAAVYNIFAFASIIPLLYIIPRMFASLHPGATGNPAFGSQDLDNTMRLVFYPAILGWSLFGFWLAQLRFRMKRVEDRSYDI